MAPEVRTRVGPRLRGLLLLAGLAWLRALNAADHPADTRNWFDDPFFQVSAAIPGCPQPAGPYLTEAERRLESHRRAEKGTTCWLAGQCERPNSYAYDRDIAEAVHARLAQSNPFANTTLWIRVQGRVVIIEGCAEDDGVAARLEAFARSLPYVEQAFANVRTDPSKRPPYRLRQGSPD